MLEKIPRFRFWCQKVLPLVYDNSLSYYEVLCKVVNYINRLIEDDKIMADDIAELQKELAMIKEWINHFDTTVLEKLIEDNLMRMIIVSLTDDGHILITIPNGWDAITFNTTEYDISLPLQPQFGHLVLSY